jgi:uncharacterized membrane protein
MSEAGNGHRHAHHQPATTSEVITNPNVSRVLWTVVASCGLLTALALVIMWPAGADDFDDPLLLDADPVDAEVVAVDLVACAAAPIQRCPLVRFEMSGGVNEDQIGTIEEASNEGELGVGDKIQVVYFEDVSGERVYQLYDYQRDSPMLILALLFAVAVVLLGRMRGLGALGGLAVSLLVLVGFTLPAILAGSSAVTVAVVSASAIAFVALFMAHGFHVSTAVALIATLASLILTAVLASIFVSATHLTGMTDDSSFLLSGLASGIDPRGILLAGVVIGALGVLDDVTVTQVSAVWQLKSVQPELSNVELVRPALQIGRDHISSTVNTLMLAYAGTSLPLLLLFVEANQGFASVITREIVATEVVRTLVGSVGLVASVPIATWLAAFVVTSASVSDVETSD